MTQEEVQVAGALLLVETSKNVQIPSKNVQIPIACMHEWTQMWT